MIPVTNILPPQHTYLSQRCASVADVAAPLQMICHIFPLIFNELSGCCRGVGDFTLICKYEVFSYETKINFLIINQKQTHLDIFVEQT